MTTALVPLVLHGIGGDVGERPWDNAEFGVADLSRMGDSNRRKILRRLVGDGLADPEEEEEETAERLRPFSRTFPGLAPGEERRLADDQLRDSVLALPEGRLGLVAAARPADVLAVGWQGSGLTNQRPEEMSVVRRHGRTGSGQCSVAVGFDTIHLLVERPPDGLERRCESPPSTPPSASTTWIRAPGPSTGARPAKW